VSVRLCNELIELRRRAVGIISATARFCNLSCNCAGAIVTPSRKSANRDDLVVVAVDVAIPSKPGRARNTRSVSVQDLPYLALVTSEYLFISAILFTDSSIYRKNWAHILRNRLRK
jgi:hypothetical protein